MFALSQLAPNRILLWIPLHVNKTSPSLVTTISISTYFAEYPPAYPIPSSFFTIANPVMKANTETVASGDCIESYVISFTYVDANLIKEYFFEAKEWKVEIETITLSSQKNTLPSDTPHNTAFIPDDDLHIFFHGGSLDHRGSCIVHRSSPSSHMKSNPTSLYRKFKTSRVLNSSISPWVYISRDYSGTREASIHPKPFNLLLTAHTRQWEVDHYSVSHISVPGFF